MKRRITFILTVFVASIVMLSQAGCGGSSPTAPNNNGGGGGGAASVIITIVGMNGSQSFSPNPATVGAGQTVAWKNADTITHDVVKDGGGFDTGPLAPGATSAPIAVGSGTVSYHCSIHPSMVGGLNGSSGNDPGPGYSHRGH